MLHYAQKRRDSTISEISKRNEVAEMFKMSISKIDYLVSTGHIPFSRLGKGSIRFDKARLVEWFRVFDEKMKRVRFNDFRQKNSRF